MDKKILYAVVVLIVLVALTLGLSFLSPSGAFKTNSFDFSLSINPSNGTLNQGQSTTSTITVSLLKGKTQDVQLSILNCPASAICILNPSNSNPPFSSVLTITANETSLGIYQIAIKGVGGSKNKTTNYILTVNPIPCECSSWTNIGCGNTCNINQLLQTRTCIPKDCAAEEQCITDELCTCNCNSWINGACGADGCVSNQRLQTRTCSPSGCNVESQCIADSLCTFPDSCEDSDGGIVSNTQGAVSGYKNNSPFNYTDRCLNNTHLTEYYCSGEAHSTTIFCFSTNTTLCLNGICV